MATKKSAKPAKRPAKKTAVKKATVKKTASKKSAAKRPAKKRSVSKGSTKKASAKKASSTKRQVKKALPKPPAGIDAAKIVIPPVPSRGTTTISSTPAPSKAAAPSNANAKKSSSSVLFLVIAGVVLLAIFALTNSSSDSDDASPNPSASESVSEEPSAEPSESEGVATLNYEAPSGFVAINNGSGVTLRWKAPVATEGLTGYLVSISYNTVDFKEVATVPADQLTLDVAKVGDEGGTQFFIQSVYSDGTKADGAKFALKGKYE